MIADSPSPVRQYLLNMSTEETALLTKESLCLIMFSPSKVKWDLTNAVKDSGFGGPFTGSCWKFLGFRVLMMLRYDNFQNLCLEVTSCLSLIGIAQRLQGMNEAKGNFRKAKGAKVACVTLGNYSRIKEEDATCA